MSIFHNFLIGFQLMLVSFLINGFWRHKGQLQATSICCNIYLEIWRYSFTLKKFLINLVTNLQSRPPRLTLATSSDDLASTHLQQSSHQKSTDRSLMKVNICVGLFFVLFGFMFFVIQCVTYWAHFALLNNALCTMYIRGNNSSCHVSAFRYIFFFLVYNFE